eukprot:9832_1
MAKYIHHRIIWNICRLAKKIDNGRATMQSAMFGLPQQMYSYNLDKNVSIGTQTYHPFTQFLKNQINTNEYAYPTTKEIVSMQDIITDYRSLINNKKTTKKCKTTEENYDKNTIRELELLAAISHKTTRNKEPDTLHLDNFVMFDHIPGNDLSVNNWRGALLLQNPMSVSESSDGPAVLLGINISNVNTDKNSVETPHYQSVKLNEKSVLDLTYVLKRSDRFPEKAMITTTHGNLLVPEIFYDLPLYFGGDCMDTVDVLTTCKFVKGLPIMGGKLHWNPDLISAERMIKAGHATVNDFKFFKGKMMWNVDLFENIFHHRNVYSAFGVKKNLNVTPVCHLLEAVWTDDDEQNCQWKKLLRFAPYEWNNWIQLQNMIKSDEILELKQIHQQMVANQIEHWRVNVKT